MRVITDDIASDAPHTSVREHCDEGREVGGEIGRLPRRITDAGDDQITYQFGVANFTMRQNWRREAVIAAKGRERE